MAMQFPMFEYKKRSIKDYRQNSGNATGTLTETAVISVISAGSAGSVVVMTTPIDVVKTRIMLSAIEESSNGNSKTITGGKVGGKKSQLAGNLP